MTNPPTHGATARFRRLRIAALAFVAVVLLLVAVFLVYAGGYSRAAAPALAALASDDAVTVVEVPSGLCFLPSGPSEPTGVLIYPGGKVDEKAYAPVAHDLAAAGYPVAIVRMPFHLAVFGIGRGSAAIRDMEDAFRAADRTGPTRYVVAGHSLGGVMGARFALTRTDVVAGVVFWASYADQDLKDSGLAALSVFGSEDGVLDGAAAERAASNLPAGSGSVVVAGGNHAGFGDYGAQSGDGTATVTVAEQRRQVVEAMIPFLASLAG